MDGHADARAVLLARGLRAMVDGCVAVLLPVYLLALGFGTFEVGLIATTTLFGSALAFLVQTYVQRRLTAVRTAVVLTTEPADTYRGFKPSAIGSPFMNEALDATRFYARFKNTSKAAAQMTAARQGHLQPQYGGATKAFPAKPVAPGPPGARAAPPAPAR